MKVFQILLNIVLGVCTIGGFVMMFLPIGNTIEVKWLFLSVVIALVINIFLSNILFEEKKKEKEKVFVKDAKFDGDKITIYFKKNQIYHIDALVCIYEDTIPNAMLIAIGEVKYCEKKYTTVEIIKEVNSESLRKLRDDRGNMKEKIFVIPAFKRKYICYL